MPYVIEITRVTVNPGEEEAMKADRPAMLRTFATDREGFLGAYLTAADNGDWLDIILWDSAEAARASAEKGGNLPEISAFFDHLATVKSMEHVTVEHIPGTEALEPRPAQR
ncbi:hypothetical protein AB0C34_27600 [Nocardia sp. NPDC049220]|uniref:hypothetical protein n=1 Tax=Nocardia sp. NPDC049220 TaxID=3155273 RepID=UPI0033C05044